MLKIGNLELDSKVILAPMAGVCDRSFKEIVREIGAGLICTEMVNDKALINENKNTLKMIEISPFERPVAVQIFGNDPQTLKEAAKILDQNPNIDLIDINMGCPAPKIVKNDSGSKILLNPQKVYDSIKAVVDNVNKPVSVKMRIGWDENNINILENAKMAEKAGASAIFLHGRTTKQQYTGTANWEIIKEVKASVNIPVIGNGDIKDPFFAKEMLEYAKVDGIMIGRAALGNPWIIKKIDHYLKTDEILEDPSINERINTILKHYEKMEKTKGEHIAIREMRGHACWYLKGLKGINKFKKEIQEIEIKEDLINILEIIKKNYEE